MIDSFISNNSNCSLYKVGFETLVRLFGDWYSYNTLVKYNNIFVDLNVITILKKSENILDSSGFIIIKTPIPKPFGWGNNEFNKSSEQFKNKLLDNYHILDNSPNLINKITNEFFIYFVFLF